MASIHDQLTCSICLELYQEPVRLPCFHVFCRKCIADNLNIPHRNQVCPECSAHIGNSASASSLKTDFKLASLVQAVKEMPKCSEHNAVVDTLEDCKAEVFCQMCCALLCVRCAFSAKHNKHDMEDLKTAVAKQKTLVNECKMTFHKMIRDLEDSVNQLKSKGECEIQSQAQKLCNLYREKEADLQQKVKYGENLLKNAVDVEKDPIRSVQIMKKDAENSHDFDFPTSPDIPKKVTIAEVFKRCPEIKRNCLQLKKLAYRYLKEIKETRSVEKPSESEKPSTSAAEDSLMFGDTKDSGTYSQDMLFGIIGQLSGDESDSFSDIFQKLE